MERTSLGSEILVGLDAEYDWVELRDSQGMPLEKDGRRPFGGVEGGEAGATIVDWEEGREETGNEIVGWVCVVRGVERGDGEDSMADEWRTKLKQSRFKFTSLLVHCLQRNNSSKL